MVPVRRQSGYMAAVCTVMGCLMAVESVRGFAEVLAEVSVEDEAGAAVAAEAGADLVIGSRCKLALNC